MRSPKTRRNHSCKDGSNEVKGNVLTRGDPVSRKVVTTNNRKSAEVIVAKSMREGLNKTSVKI